MIGLGLLCRVLWTKVKVIWQFHRRMNRGLSALYAKPLAFEKRVIETALLAEPALRKYSGDLVAAGAEHCYDFRLVHQGEHESICRLYVDRAAHAYIGLSVMTRAGQFHLFPGKPIFVLTTYFNDGTRCATISSAKTYRKAMDPRVVAAARAGTSDPAAMLRIHRTLVEREVATGRTAEPVDPESFGQRTVDEHAESQSYYATHPIYTWGDALHEAFKVPRKLERLVGNRKPD